VSKSAKVKKSSSSLFAGIGGDKSEIHREKGAGKNWGRRKEWRVEVKTIRKLLNALGKGKEVEKIRFEKGKRDIVLVEENKNVPESGGGQSGKKGSKGKPEKKKNRSKNAEKNKTDGPIQRRVQRGGRSEKGIRRRR